MDVEEQLVESLKRYGFYYFGKDHFRREISGIADKKKLLLNLYLNSSSFMPKTKMSILAFNDKSILTTITEEPISRGGFVRHPEYKSDIMPEHDEIIVYGDSIRDVLDSGYFMLREIFEGFDPEYKPDAILTFFSKEGDSAVYHVVTESDGTNNMLGYSFLDVPKGATFQDVKKRITSMASKDYRITEVIDNYNSH